MLSASECFHQRLAARNRRRIRATSLCWRWRPSGANWGIKRRDGRKPARPSRGRSAVNAPLLLRPQPFEALDKLANWRWLGRPRETRREAVLAPDHGILTAGVVGALEAF